MPRMTLDDLIKQLQSIKSAGVPGDTPITAMHDGGSFESRLSTELFRASFDILKSPLELEITFG